MIRGTVGRGGSGKSLTTVARLHALYKKGREIISNTPLIDLRVRKCMLPDGSQGWLPVNAATFGTSWAAGYVTTFSSIYDLDNCEVFIDEMGAWMPKKDHAKIPDEVTRFLNQDRREGVNLWWTHRTTRVFYEVWDNTAELTRCTRYGPFVRMEQSDPESPADKPVTKWEQVKPELFDLYDTYAKVGNASGEGYGQGKRINYSGKSTGRYWQGELETVDGRSLFAKIPLREGQVVCMIRKFGPDSVGLLREENRSGFVRYKLGHA